AAPASQEVSAAQRFEAYASVLRPGARVRVLGEAEALFSGEPVLRVRRAVLLCAGPDLHASAQVLFEVCRGALDPKEAVDALGLSDGLPALA
ncbi:unnamed protein product, partial [Polarella glacialis]